ncbi:MAG: hypothetical protein CO002_04570 [Candidatus Portnoybacteria bacterium CG_4_8_14_3_um_filter_44_10]|uniref:Uncharacterized protein n=5 Tax=Candidatus Portnoyibacteriota TaxID=1817913 RepID=A0A2H0KPY2_9BACT|nr:MAG: hypothetical protein AUK17_00595 [Parcubacteria group bacterium CG2_30_44_18]PIQ74221.1 MAG: hypothetical protein COV85_03260 [Candidatus Portnoybacteria bacterium CG11_big_fil_rev_8_21_14_0_20_44_10]PIS16864.1 MAG: hypothetical protein COT61_01650 [Candidatus Portnoybacteria bacterium CG09_land_8_20_14_0_10_44_13]PIW74981.1 MAG: hypothetical protein CO002_04570 [Candidatus Portnoybacteria bacterium CG_4_8_14_3_um_filter_44_10]PIZ70203.1 MAG: hypothetical protein COY11_03050 [Candidatus
MSEGDRKVAVEIATADLVKDLVAQITALQEQKTVEEARGTVTTVALEKKKNYVKLVLGYFA